MYMERKLSCCGDLPLPSHASLELGMAPDEALALDNAPLLGKGDLEPDRPGHTLAQAGFLQFKDQMIGG